MKKTLLALAALAAASASFAQSSVTLYGVVDASVESVKGNNTVTRVSSGNLASSRLGFKGTEDLGDGLKANFTLEAPLNVDAGTANTTTFWDRQAWVGAAGGFGELRLGRTDTPIGDIAGNVLGAQAYDDLKLLAARAGDSHRRVSNAITYMLPTLVPGLTGSLQYSTGTETYGANNGKAYGLSVKYAAGPLSAGLGYEYAKDDAAAAGDQKANATLVYAGYDFGMAKVTGYYDAETNTGNTAGLRRMTVLGAKVAVPVSPELTVIAGLSTARNTKGNVAGDDNVQIVSLKGIYNLSKRTAVYGLFTNVNNDTATNFGLVAANTDKTTHGIAAGVRHSF